MQKMGLPPPLVSMESTPLIPFFAIFDVIFFAQYSISEPVIQTMACNPYATNPVETDFLASV